MGGGGEGACMAPDPLAARAFGARNLPCLVLKSGYSPVNIDALKFKFSFLLIISAMQH